MRRTRPAPPRAPSADARPAHPRYAASAFAAFTGWNWRRLREIGVEITGLKAELAPLKKQIDEAGEGGPPALVASQAAELTAKIDELSATRKALASDNLREKHYQVGSVILGLGAPTMFEGGAPPASVDYLKAWVSPTHPGAPPLQRR